MPDLVAQNCQLTLSAITLKTPFPRSMSVIGDISTTIRIKCSQLNIFLLRIAGSSTSKTVRDSSKTRKTDNADTHHHLNTGVRPRWRVLRPYPLGSERRGRHSAGDNIVDSPHRLHAWLVPLIVWPTGDESKSRVQPYSLRLNNNAERVPYAGLDHFR